MKLPQVMLAVVEQVADVLAAHQDTVLVVLEQTSPAGSVSPISGEAALAVGDRAAGRSRDAGQRTIGLAGDHVDRAGRRRTIGVGIGVVAHREVLGVVPESGDGVAVEIAHHLAVGAESADAAGGAATGEFREQVVLAVVIGLLLGCIAVVLRLRVRLRAVETERVRGTGAVRRVGEVRIVEQQAVVVGQEVVRPSAYSCPPRKRSRPGGWPRSDRCRNSDRTRRSR